MSHYPFTPDEYRGNAAMNNVVRINWGSYTTGELAIADCPDCGDPCLVEKGDSRCETCKQYDQDSAAAMLRAHAPTVAVAALKAWAARGVSFKGRGGMNDERQVFCDFCGDEALAIPGDMLAEQADGMQLQCWGCHKPGKVVLHDDEGSCWLTFAPLKDGEG